MIWRILTRTTLFYLLGVFEFIVTLAFAFVVISFYGEAIPTGKLRTKGDVYFYVRSNGIHTELSLPSKTRYADWESFLPLDDYAPDTPHDFVSLGWGDKGFYMNTPDWADLSMNTAFNAIVLPSPTAMHVTYHQEPQADANCIKVYVTAEEYQKMVRFIRKSFQPNGEQALLIPNKGYGMYDNFYEANDSYHLFSTCNTWTSCALRRAEVRTAVLAVFPNGVMGHLK